MREDLDFLFQKAKRSKDWLFIDEVAILHELDGRIEDAIVLYGRSEKFFLNGCNIWNVGESKLDFLIKG